jgi:hypothetical protein
MNYEASKQELEDRLFGIITDKTALPITIRNSGSQKLSVPFVELHFSEVDPVGWGEETISASNVTSGCQEWEISVDVSCHRHPNPEVILQKILHTFNTSSATYYKYFKTQDSGFLRSSSIRRRDFPVDKIQWEPRAFMTLVFSLVSTEEDVTTLDYITTVSFNGGDDGSINTIITENTILSDELTVTYP